MSIASTHDTEDAQVELVRGDHVVDADDRRAALRASILAADALGIGLRTDQPDSWDAAITDSIGSTPEHRRAATPAMRSVSPHGTHDR